MKKLNRCKLCDKPIREWNKSGYCSNCGGRILRNKDSLLLIKKKKLYLLKKLVDELLEGGK